jgi:hypothetical protein
VVTIPVPNGKKNPGREESDAWPSSSPLLSRGLGRARPLSSIGAEARWLGPSPDGSGWCSLGSGGALAGSGACTERDRHLVTGWRPVPGGGDGGSGWNGSGAAAWVDGGRCGRCCALVRAWTARVPFSDGSTWQGCWQTAGRQHVVAGALAPAWCR